MGWIRRIKAAESSQLMLVVDGGSGGDRVFWRRLGSIPAPRACAASRRAQSWNVGQTGNALDRQYASWCATARGAGGRLGEAPVSMVRAR